MNKAVTPSTVKKPKITGYDPVLAALPKPKLQPAVQPLPICVKLEPEFVECQSPVSVEAQTSPAIEGWALIALTALLEPRLTVSVNETPPSVDL